MASTSSASPLHCTEWTEFELCGGSNSLEVCGIIAQKETLRISCEFFSDLLELGRASLSEFRNGRLVLRVPNISTMAISLFVNFCQRFIDSASDSSAVSPQPLAHEYALISSLSSPHFVIEAFHTLPDQFFATDKLKNAMFEVLTFAMAFDPMQYFLLTWKMQLPKLYHVAIANAICPGKVNLEELMAEMRRLDRESMSEGKGGSRLEVSVQKFRKACLDEFPNSLATLLNAVRIRSAKSLSPIQFSAAQT
jgi:hypothetical protein